MSKKVITQNAPGGGVYFVAFVGAAVYFVQQSHGFLGFIWALIEAAVWPGIVLYKVLELLHVSG